MCGVGGRGTLLGPEGVVCFLVIDDPSAGLSGSAGLLLLWGWGAGGVGGGWWGVWVWSWWRTAPGVGVGFTGAAGAVRTLRTAQWTRASLWPS